MTTNKYKLPLLVLFILISYFQIKPFGYYYSPFISIKGAIALLKILLVPTIWIWYSFFCSKRDNLFVALTAYLFFLVWIIAEKISYETYHSTTLVMYSVLSIAIGQTLTWLQIPNLKSGIHTSVRIFLALILFTLLVIPATYITYYLSFNVSLTPEIIFAILQTNTDEAKEFIYSFIPLKYILLTVFITIFITSLTLFASKKKLVQTKSNFIFIGFVLLFSVTAIKADSLRVISQPFKTIKTYYTELEEFKNTLKRRKEGVINVDARKNGSGETYLVIIGESLNKQHMSMYNYFRDTTPGLKQMVKDQEIIAYNNAFSNHIQTMLVLSKALTEANQINNKDYFKSASLVDLAKQADFETYWFTNQNLMGAWDNLASVIAHSADRMIGLNSSVGRTTTTRSKDENLIPLVQDVLKTNDNNKIIFVHLMGSHNDYCSRYPSNFEKFNSQIKSLYKNRNLNEADIKKDVKRINCYDNSVIYNDYVVTSLINELKNKGGVSAAIYFSDHGEDVFYENGHNSGKFNFAMTGIPLLFWASDDYKIKYAEKIINLENHKDLIFTNDFIYDTVAGLTGIKTDTADPRFDLTDTRYGLKAKEATTLHGKKQILDDENFILWQPDKTYGLFTSENF